MNQVNRLSSQRSSFETLESRQFFAAGPLEANAAQLVFGDVVGGASSASRTITFSNTGTAPLTIPAGGISISGASAAQFHITSGPASEIVVAPGASLGVAVNF